MPSIERVGPVLQTKLSAPPLRADLVRRPASLARLDEGLEAGRRVILVSAAAGFGKTTLVSEWVGRIQGRGDGGVLVAWLGLDAGDNDAARFWSYLEASLRQAGARLGTADESRGPSYRFGGGPSTTALASACNQIGTLSSPLVIVLDDYHLIVSESVHEIVRYLVDRQPHSLRVLITTRADPPLPVARLRAPGELIELRQNDLRFSIDESAQFPGQLVGSGLSTEDVATLRARTEGWIAGLQMASLAIRARDLLAAGDDVSGFVRDFAGSHRYVMDYLIEEVLGRQPPDVQTFLERTSILDELSGSLCNAVLTGGPSVEASDGASAGDAPRSREMLEYLERANLFVVPLDSRREWYRYHRLFSDIILRERFVRSKPDYVPVLHSRASAWYENHGRGALAIDHALAAAEPDRAARLTEQHAEATLMAGEASTFLGWVDALPAVAVASRGSL